MKYTLVYTRRATRDIQKLEGKIKKRIGDTLRRYSEDPFKYASKITDARLGSYRFRIGEYRIIFDLEGNKIVVLRVGHRRDIYRKL